MKKILPIETHPIMQAYYGQAFPFCIVESKYKSIVDYLICNKFINCIFNKKDEYNLIYVYDSDSWFESIYLIKHTSYMCKDKKEEYVDEAICKIKNHIMDDYYIFASINEGRLSAKNHGKKYDYDHDCFIYGFDDDKKVFKSIGYIDWQFMTFEIPYSEYKDALLNLISGVVEIQFFKLNPDFVMGILDTKSIKTKLTEYVSSQINDFIARPEINKYIVSGDLKFGINAWDEFANYINGSISNDYYVDMRYVKNYFEHKKLMFMRIKYLNDNQYINNENYVKISSEISENAKRLILLTLKSSKQKQSGSNGDAIKTINYITDRVKEINKIEREYLGALINDL